MKENEKSEKYFYMVLHNCRKIIKIILGGVMAFRLIKFWDVGALVWFAHIVEWQFLYVQY